MDKWLASGLFSSRKMPRDNAEAVDSLEQTAETAKGSALLPLIESWCKALEPVNRGGINCWMEEELPHDANSLLSECEEPNPSISAASQHSCDDAFNKARNFRALFLRSHALEKLLKNCLQDTQISPNAWPMLEKLLRACLESGTTFMPLPIAEKLKLLSEACSLHKTKIAASRNELIDMVVEAVSVVKVRADLVDVDSKILDLRNCGAGVDSIANTSGTGVASVSTKLPEKLRAARQELEKRYTLWKLVRLRNSIFERGLERESHHGDMSRLLQNQLDTVLKSHKVLKDEIGQTEAGYDNQVVKRDKCVKELQQKVSAAQTEVLQLQLEKHRLEEQLREVTLKLEGAEQHCAEVTEDLHVYEEGDNLLLDGMIHKSNELRDEATQHLEEERAMGVAHEIVEHLHELLSKHAAEGRDCAKSLQDISEHQWLETGKKYCSKLLDEVHLLIRQARFCQDELKSLLFKQDKMSEIGMQSMMIDVDRSLVTTRQKYLRARSSIGILLEEGKWVRQQMNELAQLWEPALDQKNELDCSSTTVEDDLGDRRADQSSVGLNLPTVTNPDLENQVPSFPEVELSSVFEELHKLEVEYDTLIRPETLFSTSADGSNSDSSFESVGPEPLSDVHDEGDINNGGL